jgi:hypothetical protein
MPDLARMVSAFLLILLTGLVISSAMAAPRSVAIFDFEFIDTSLEGAVNGPRADEQTRVRRLDQQLRNRLKQSEQFQIIDTTSVAGKAHNSNLQACGGCDADLANSLGADWAITGTVQKVSNLILNINLYVRDAKTRKLIANMSADMRGNTDESWSRTLDWLLRNRLLMPNFGMHP